jgi:hypothetical protein
MKDRLMPFTASMAADVLARRGGGRRLKAIEATITCIREVMS